MSIMCRNQISLLGIVEKQPQFYFKQNNANYYRILLAVERTSGTKDIIPVIISEKQAAGIEIGDCLNIYGKIVSHTVSKNSSRNKLVINVKAKDISTAEKPYPDSNNWVELDGFICKTPTVRKTSTGINICDFMLAVNIGKKSDYIPVISWYRNAEYMSEIPIGTFVSIEGRLQSREYKTMRGRDTGPYYHTVYEVSVFRINKTDSSKNDPVTKEVDLDLE